MWPLYENPLTRLLQLAEKEPWHAQSHFNSVAGRDTPVSHTAHIGCYVTITCTYPIVEVGKNIDQCIATYLFSLFNIDSENPMNHSSKQRPPTTRCPSLDASRFLPPAAGSASPMTSLEGWRMTRRRNTAGAAEAGSWFLMHRSFRDCKLQAQPVSPWPLHRAPVGSSPPPRRMEDVRASKVSDSAVALQYSLCTPESSDSCDAVVAWVVGVRPGWPIGWPGFSVRCSLNWAELCDVGHAHFCSNFPFAKSQQIKNVLLQTHLRQFEQFAPNFAWSICGPSSPKPVKRIVIDQKMPKI